MLSQRSPRRYSRSPQRRYSRSPGRRHSRSPRRRTPSHDRGYRRSEYSPARDMPKKRMERENPDPSNVLGVFGLSPRTTSSEIQDVFRKYGRIEKVNLVMNRQTGESRGFAFIYFESVEEAREAREATNGMDIDGRPIRVDFSITKKPHDPTPGFYAGRPIRYGHSGPRSSGSSRRRSRSRSRSPYQRRERRRSYSRSPPRYHRD